jgi:hypothetical protein
MKKLKRSGKDKVAFGMANRTKKRKPGMKTTPLLRCPKGGSDSSYRLK